MRASTCDTDLISALFQHLRQTPNRCALRTSSSQLSYLELYANMLQNKAQFERAFCSDKPIVVCLNRSPQLLSCLLTLQWMSIPYIPVDTHIPQARLQAIIEQAEVQAVIFDANSDRTAPACQTFYLEEASPLTPPELPDTPVRPSPQKACYIIFTSGSTGTPKGVEISHRALSHFLSSISPFFLNEPQACFLAATTIAFDISALELFLPLWKGQSVFIASNSEHKDPFELSRLLTQMPITTFQATPAMWQLLCQTGWQGQSKLTALCGGEALTASLASTLLDKVAALWNMYGPTEATIWCALKQITANLPITIGKALPGMAMYVLDESLKPLPKGTKGELYIAGPSLATGYINQAALTDEKFIKTPEGRLYRVGDIAMQTLEGEFQIFGRTDNQIKHHGYRIELEEIDAIIKQLSWIESAATVLQGGQLVAYLCLAPSARYDKSQLLSFLSTKLPDYMLPERIVLLTQLPLNANGKVDRKALSQTPLKRQAAPAAPPSTALEKAIALIWSNALNIELPDIHDDFFDLGGHSLSALRVIAEIASSLDIKLTLTEFYEHPTLHQLARFVDSASASSCKSARKSSISLALHRAYRFAYRSRKPLAAPKRLPLNHFQLMFWFSKLFDAAIKRISVACKKRIQGPIDFNALSQALQAAYISQEAFAYEVSPYYPIQKRKALPTLNWTVKNLADFPKEKAEAYLRKAFEDLYTNTNWQAKGPKIKPKLFYLPDGQIELHLAMSHFIADETALDVFLDSLSSHYLSAVNQSLMPKPNPKLLHAHARSHHHLRKKHGRKDTRFWKDYLKEAALFTLPKQYIIPEAKPSSFQYSSYLELSEALVSQLQLSCLHHQLSVTDILSTLTSRAFMDVCKDEVALPKQLFFSVTQSLRDTVDYDTLVGCFLNSSSIKLDLSPELNLIQASKQAQRSRLETHEFQRAPALVRIASIGQLPKKQMPVRSFLVNSAIHMAATLATPTQLDPELVKACGQLFPVDRSHVFFVGINILNTFLTPKTKGNPSKLFACQAAPIPHHPYNLTMVNNVVDVCFYRDEAGSNSPYVVLSSNLVPEFRERVLKSLVGLLEALS